ncbi:unnamed protein product, partial [Brassica oleracea var. botrytis]
ATPGHVGKNQAQWYYPAGFTHQQHQHHQQAVPFYIWFGLILNYRHPSSYVAPTPEHDLQSIGYIGGTYMNGYYAQPQPQPLYYNHHHLYGGGRVMVGASPMMPLYTFYPYHQSQAIGFTQPSFTKPISTHPISGILSFYPKPYNVS